MKSETRQRGFLRSSPYWPVVTHRLLRRILPGLAISALGDGMSVVAVSWLALQLAPPGQRGTWVAIAVAAYSLPSAAGGVLLGRLMRGRNGAQLAGWNSVLRATGLGAVVVFYAIDELTISRYVVMLAISSLLAAWGSAGRYTLIAEVLPKEHHLAANAVMTVIGEFATIAGPPLAGLLIGWSNAAVVICIDAASFAVLALTYRLAVPRSATDAPVGSSESRSVGFRVIWHSRTLLGLLVLSFGFFFLFGPFYVAMPVHVDVDLHLSATVLGLYYTVFGIGAVAGGLVTGYLSKWPLWPTTIGIVVGFGAAMLPLGLGAPAGISLFSFALAGAIWAPYMSTSMALFQRVTPAGDLPQVLAANGSIIVLSIPLGTVLGGPLVSAVGAREALLLCAVLTVALGAVAAAVVAVFRRRSVLPESIDQPTEAESESA